MSRLNSKLSDEEETLHKSKQRIPEQKKRNHIERGDKVCAGDKSIRFH
jgi:hypothetical protein